MLCPRAWFRRHLASIVCLPCHWRMSSRMIDRSESTICVVIRAAGVCANNAALRKDRTTNANGTRLCFRRKSINFVILISQKPLGCKHGTPVCENSRCTEWMARILEYRKSSVDRSPLKKDAVRRVRLRKCFVMFL